MYCIKNDDYKFSTLLPNHFCSQLVSRTVNLLCCTYLTLMKRKWRIMPLVIIKFKWRRHLHPQICHCEFLEYWNTQKSVWRIRQRFSCLLDEGIPKKWKKLNSYDGFLSYLQNSTANSVHLAAHFCTALVYPQKATVRIQFLPYFWNPLIK